ncbi:uncharacterized protein I303_107139 [Kwoniella dejecticola CBS 10117]|uniref:Uncharacterized protein n=1 Tax=Kwoniella dejecticola CBS 10117 TaxID=1296121 RepID=A0A1A5ZYU6_9TREE|nr:uncharacterized protein I303_06540 [Kwoniella dejecticola CBS 10117]OBR82982.1 hypothetical protein I303_06540 [Kwoniella dejecticola CBS 10117]
MPTSLLSLSDETIQHIGYFLHTDNFIPIPFFHPHWENYASEIDPKVQKDYVAFRSTCRRMRTLSPIKGLHIKLKTFERLCSWTTAVPQTVLDGVRRLDVGIPTDKSRSLAATWSTLVFLFSMLNNLEELVFTDSLICVSTLYISINQLFEDCFDYDALDSISSAFPLVETVQMGHHSTNLGVLQNGAHLRAKLANGQWIIEFGAYDEFDFDFASFVSRSVGGPNKDELLTPSTSGTGGDGIMFCWMMAPGM